MKTLQLLKKIEICKPFGDAYDYKIEFKTIQTLSLYHALNSNSIGESCFASDDFMV
jgi:hypothetical protein